MSKRESELYLQDILISIQRIEEYTEGLSSKDFEADWKTIYEDLPSLKEEIAKIYPPKS